jgi:thiamine-phosphate pyrophosphorylase
VILITDPRYTLVRTVDVIKEVGDVLGPGRLAVQLRDKSAPAPALASAARALRAATERAGALLVLNAPSPEALHVALDVGADGVHVPCRRDAMANVRARLGPSAWLSAPAHTDDDVTVAAAAGATAVLVSPIFDTPGKGPPRGVEALTAARRLGAEALAIHALGGVSTGTAAACANAGADGVAVIRALLEAADPRAVARDLDAPFQA